MHEEGDLAHPTLRCPSCSSADLHFLPSGSVRCSRCLRRYSREELERWPGTPGRHSTGTKERREHDGRDRAGRDREPR